MPDPFSRWRTGRAYRDDRIYFWSPTAQLPPFLDVNPTGTNYLTIDADLALSQYPAANTTRQGNDTNRYVMSVDVSPTASTGVKTVTWLDSIDHTTVHTLDITVATRPTATAANVSLASGRAGIQAAIDGGYSPIILDPGDYVIDHQLRLDTGSPATVVEIDGRGMASFTRLPEAGFYYNQFFRVAGSLTLKGIKFRVRCPMGAPGQRLVLDPNDPGTYDINVIGCTFEDCASASIMRCPTRRRTRAARWCRIASSSARRSVRDHRDGRAVPVP